jgi:arylsulfatase A-like enzyme
MMQYLTEKKVVNNTIIIFMSDNGGLSLSPARGKIAHVQNLPLRAGKGSVYEGGIRIPMIIKWPSVSIANSVSNQYIIAEDIYPSIIAMANLSKQTPIQQIDGKSFVPFIKQPNLLDSSRFLVWHYPNKWIDQDGPGINYKSAIRKGAFKLVYDLRTGNKELYNLNIDMGEHFNIAINNTAKTKELTQLLKKYLADNHAPMPIDKKTRLAVEILSN